MSLNSYYDAIIAYKAAMNYAESLKTKGLITDEEFTIISTKMQEKYQISSDSLFVRNDLIIIEKGGNITPNK